MNQQTSLNKMLLELSYIPKERWTSFRFTCNEVLYEWDKSLAVYSLNGSIFKRDRKSEHYCFQAENGNGFTLIMSLNTATLEAASYPDCTGQLKLEKNNYSQSKIGDFMTLIISSLYDGYADGTMVGQITKHRSSDKIFLVNGEFKNVKVLL